MLDNNNRLRRNRLTIAHALTEKIFLDHSRAKVRGFYCTPPVTNWIPSSQTTQFSMPESNATKPRTAFLFS
jgi:hypothetical protein